MKKNFLFTIISLSVCITLCGQTISQSNNRYRGNDVLEKKQITVKGYSLSNTKGVWSLEEAELSEESYNAEYTTETDTLMAVERSNRTYYSQDRGAGSGQIPIDCTGLRKGQYIIYINADGDKYAEKVNFK